MLLGDPGEAAFCFHGIAIRRFHHQLFQFLHDGKQSGKVGQTGEAVVHASIPQASHPSGALGLICQSSRQLPRLIPFPDQDVFVEMRLGEFLEELVYPGQRSKVVDGLNSQDHHFNQLNW
jgi:hypothetical protein